MSESMSTLLDLRHYETVVAIVDFGSMTRAAQYLAISQSALSHRLSEAERRLSTPLFNRGADRRLTPTPAGLAVYQAANRALGELRRIESSLVSGQPEAETVLRVGVGAYEAYHWFPRCLREVRERRPDIDLDLISVPDPVGTALADRSVDIALAPGYPNGTVALIPAFDDELVLICSPEHPLANRGHIEPIDVIDETMLTYSMLPTTGFEYDRFIRPSGYSARLVRVVRHTSAIIELVAAGAGVSILSRWATAPAVEMGRLAAVRCGVDGLSIPWHLVVRDSDATAASIARLIGEQLRARD